MPKYSHGPKLQKRVKRLFEDLLEFVNGDVLDLEIKDLHWRWQQEYSDCPELVIETKLRTLRLLTQKDNDPGELTKEQINPILTYYLKDFLEILSDNRTVTKGSEYWNFTLKLWSKKKAQNLKKFDEEWEIRRTRRSKRLKNKKTCAIPHDFRTKYTEKYRNRCNLIKLLGMSQGVPLESIYTNIDLYKSEELKGLDSITTLEEAYRTNEDRGFLLKKFRKESGIAVVNNHKFLMILGGPGTGKTTFLRKIGLEALKGQIGEYKHPYIPVLIELKNFQSGKIDLEAAIAKEFLNCGLLDYEDFAVKCLENGKLLILFDGFDELPREQMGNMRTAIQNFVNSYSDNRFIVSCRIAAYRYNFLRFTDMAIAEFDNSQIKSFITKWFQSKPKQGENCWNELTSHNHVAAKELAQNPLLLTLICLLYQRASQFPTNRATLYEKALRVLLEEWNAEKEIPNHPRQIYKGLDTKRKESMLAEIAHNSFCDDRFFFQEREIAKQIEQILKEMLSEESINGRHVLEDIEMQHGLLVTRAETVYSFSHLTIQEFLTAQHIYDDDEKIKQLVVKNLYDTRWREVFLLLSGLKNNADNLLLMMEKKIQTDVSIPRLQRFLIWVEKVTNSSEESIKPVAKRTMTLANALANTYANNYAYVYSVDNNLRHAYAIAYLKNFSEKDFLFHAYTLASIYISFFSNTYANANVLTYAYALAKSYSNTLGNISAQKNIRVYNNALDEFISYAEKLLETRIFQNVNFTLLIARLKNLKNQIPHKDKPRNIHQQFSRSIINTWLEAFHLTPELVSLSKQEFEVIDTKYLYANLLMVECKQAAVRVSPETWQSIESRMLLPVVV